MRMTASTIAIVLAALTGVTAGAAPPPPQTIPCDGVILRPRELDGSYRVLLGRVAFRRTPVFRIAEVGGPLPYWSKVLLFVRAGGTPITITVPEPWRIRAAITWGSPAVHALRVGACPTPPPLLPDRWNGYAGGLYVREPACVPLRVRVATRSATVRLGIGRAC